MTKYVLSGAENTVSKMEKASAFACVALDPPGSGDGKEWSIDPDRVRLTVC